ncbi:MAG: hypothetical protein KBC32_10625 [Candidatus Didemnitutus sp.]|nr:hypothetical protein [Candidatus Didemnitutus sp.]
MTPLPHSSQLNVALQKLISDATQAKTAGASSFSGSPRLKHLYRLCNAVDGVLDGLDAPQMKPSLQAARSIVLNQPVLLLYSFMSEAFVDLRRFTELIMWNIYFTDHPVEWREFLENAGFSRDIERPISFCAHRELGFYLAYAKELLEREPSGLAAESLEGLQAAVRELNKHAHGATLAALTRREDVLTPRSDADAKALCDQASRVFTHATVVLCAVHRKRFDKLGAAPRAYFDFLVGAPLAKKIRAGQFGLGT